MMLKQFLLIAVCAAVTVGCTHQPPPQSSGAASPPPAHRHFLGGQQIKGLLTGAEVRFVNPQTGYPTRVRYRGNGAFAGETDSGPRRSKFRGIWWIKEPNRFCVKTRRQTTCSRVRHLRANRYMTLTDGGREILMHVVK